MSTSKCYFPDGSVSEIDTPCNATAEQSACCKPGVSCLNNGICLQWNGVYSRGSCTDSSWNHSNCAQVCHEENRDSGINVYLCEKTEGTGAWACGNNSCTSDTFSMSMLKAALRPEELSSSYSEVFGVPTATTTGNASAEQASSNETTYTSGQMAGVGVGIAVPLLIALSTVVWLLLAEKKKTKARADWERQWNEQNARYDQETMAQKRTSRNAELGPDGERHELPAPPTELEDLATRATDTSQH